MSALALTPVVATKSLAAITDTGASTPSLEQPEPEDFNIDLAESDLQFYAGDTTEDNDFAASNMVAPDTLEDPLEEACIDVPVPADNFNNHPQPYCHPTADSELQPAPPHIIELPIAHRETPAV
ncbi:hypothetical protein F4604DRAFT_1930403 [Suillus subluteus]|nr:hypothetical protein F4604DRAFT_1930403 [Suillus subluteus]